MSSVAKTNGDKNFRQYSFWYSDVFFSYIQFSRLLQVKCEIFFSVLKKCNEKRK